MFQFEFWTQSYGVVFKYISQLNEDLIVVSWLKITINWWRLLDLNKHINHTFVKFSQNNIRTKWTYLELGVRLYLSPVGAPPVRREGRGMATCRTLPGTPSRVWSCREPRGRAWCGNCRHGTERGRDLGRGLVLLASEFHIILTIRLKKHFSLIFFLYSF